MNKTNYLGMEVRRNCPYCITNGKSADTKEHLYINTEKGVGFCHRCNWSGPWTGVLDKSPLKPKKEYKIDLFTFDIKGGEEVFKYCLTRLPEEVIHAKVRWSPDIMDRAFFPVWGGGVVQVWQGRGISPDVHPKFLTWGKCSEYLYNFESVSDWCVVTEGIMSALSTPNGIAMMGKSLSETQKKLVISKYNKVFLCLDPDARREQEKIKRVLNPYIEIKEIFLEEGTDPNVLGFEEMKKRIYEAEKI